MINFQRKELCDLASREQLTTFRTRINRTLLSRKQKWGLDVVRLYLATVNTSTVPVYPAEPPTLKGRVQPSWHHVNGKNANRSR